MLDLIKPENFMPIYGERYMLHENAKIALNEGINPENIFVCRNGEVLEFKDENSPVTRG
jgi:ribonuclease J